MRDYLKHLFNKFIYKRFYFEHEEYKGGYSKDGKIEQWVIDLNSKHTVKRHY